MDTPTYWHGGPAGLNPGDTLLPRTQLPQLPPAFGSVTGEQLAALDQYAEHDPAHVYVTTDEQLAGHFAGWHARHPAGGTVYEVRPDGQLTTDPDFPAVSYRCPSATIISATPATAGQNPHAGKPYTTWEDNETPMYGADGYALPSPVGSHLGVTADDLRDLGPWPEYPQIHGAIEKAARARRPGLTHEDIKRVALRFQPTPQEDA